MDKKQNSYDDFAAVAEDLISRRITSSRHLGIMGGSNGGLLVGAVFVQRPELFNAVVCQVPLLDMKRYHTLLAGNSWMAEYGILATQPRHACEHPRYADRVRVGSIAAADDDCSLIQCAGMAHTSRESSARDPAKNEVTEIQRYGSRLSGVFQRKHGGVNATAFVHRE